MPLLPLVYFFAISSIFQAHSYPRAFALVIPTQLSPVHFQVFGLSEALLDREFKLELSSPKTSFSFTALFVYFSFYLSSHPG